MSNLAREPVTTKMLPRPTVLPGYKGMSAAEKLTYKLLESVSHGHLVVITPEGERHSFGLETDSLSARLVVKNKKFFDRIVVGGSLALGESFLDGWWEVEGDKLTDFFGVLLSNHLYETFRENYWYAAKVWMQTCLWNPKSILSARRCIQRHYDLSNDFFALFLDPTLAYSCGYQKAPGDDLAMMQQHKYERICRKLDLAGKDSFLDIGCGWGGLLIYAAQHYPHIKATGITISAAQAGEADRRIRALGLSRRVHVELCDYREFAGSFDAVASVGMFEHVGLANYRAFMQKLADVTNSKSAVLLHTIGLTDPPRVKPDPWTVKYIFPGSRLPRLPELFVQLERAGFAAAHVENWKLHYAETLRHWKENVDHNRSAIRRLGSRFDDRFLRMWNYYLQVCEAGFRYSTVQLYQLLLTPAEQWSLPMTFNFG